MLAIEPLRTDGTGVIHWSISDILDHRSIDMAALGYLEYQQCTACGAVMDDWGKIRNDPEDPFYCIHFLEPASEPCPEDQHDFKFVDRATAWELLLSEKRSDDHYDDVVDTISTDGFTKELTAWPNGGELVFGDGHHRLAAAIDLGMSTVPVRIHEEFSVEPDSGAWSRSTDEEDW